MVLVEYIVSQKPSHSSEYNFASSDVGAKIIAASPGSVSPSRILNEDEDKYMLIPKTNALKSFFFVVELSEVISMKRLAVANYEYYSCGMKTFKLYGRVKETESWDSLGIFEAENTKSVQTFELDDQKLVRYIMLNVTSIYQEIDSFYCTLSLLRVHGETLYQDLVNIISVDSDEQLGNIPPSIQNDESIQNFVEPSKSLDGEEELIAKVKSIAKIDSPITLPDFDPNIQDVDNPKELIVDPELLEKLVDRTLIDKISTIDDDELIQDELEKEETNKDESIKDELKNEESKSEINKTENNKSEDDKEETKLNEKIITDINKVADPKSEINNEEIKLNELKSDKSKTEEIKNKDSLPNDLKELNDLKKIESEFNTENSIKDEQNDSKLSNNEILEKPIESYLHQDNNTEESIINDTDKNIEEIIPKENINNDQSNDEKKSIELVTEKNEQIKTDSIKEEIINNSEELKEDILSINNDFEKIELNSETKIDELNNAQINSNKTSDDLNQIENIETKLNITNDLSQIEINNTISEIDNQENSTLNTIESNQNATYSKQKISEQTGNEDRPKKPLESSGKLDSSSVTGPEINIKKEMSESEIPKKPIESKNSENTVETQTPQKQDINVGRKTISKIGKGGRENVLRSMLNAIQQLETENISLARQMKKLREQYKEAFQKITNVLAQKNDEINVLAESILALRKKNRKFRMECKDIMEKNFQDVVQVSVQKVEQKFNQELSTFKIQIKEEYDKKFEQIRYYSLVGIFFAIVINAYFLALCLGNPPPAITTSKKNNTENTNVTNLDLKRKLLSSINRRSRSEAFNLDDLNSDSEAY